MPASTVFLHSKKGDIESPVRAHAHHWLTNEHLHPKSADDLQESPLREKQKFLLSCKVAIEMHNGVIRFCLDGLDLDHARNPDLEGYNSYTSEELRFIAINWDQVANKIVFYDHGQRIDAPWGTMEPSDWLTSYQPVLGSPQPSPHQDEGTKQLRQERLRRLRNNKKRKLEFPTQSNSDSQKLFM